MPDNLFECIYSNRTANSWKKDTYGKILDKKAGRETKTITKHIVSGIWKPGK